MPRALHVSLGDNILHFIELDGNISLALAADLYEDAADVWNTALGSAKLKENPTLSAASIHIRAFEGDYKCAGAIGCVDRTNDADYPDMGARQPFWIENVPQWHDSPALKWTMRFENYEMQPDQFEFLPYIIVHEFGHALGLAQYKGIESVMSGGGKRYDVGGPTCTATDRTLCHLPASDRNAIGSIY